MAPFGIWKNGVPDGIAGLDAYNVIYADAVNWLDQQWIDYLVPLLSWGFGGRQDYGTLASWWADHAARNGRHLYTGHGLYRADRNTFAGTLHDPEEIPQQVRFNRADPAIQGGVYFRARNISQLHSQGFADTLKMDLYRYPALPAPMDWRPLDKPAPPNRLAYEWTGAEEVTLRWTPASSDGQAVAARMFAVYRVRAENVSDPSIFLDDPRYLIAVTSETEITDRPGFSDTPYYYFVTSVSANSVESEPSGFGVLEGRATSTEPLNGGEAVFTLRQNYPNPFKDRTVIRFVIDEPRAVSLRIYNVVGQLVATLIDGDVVFGAKSIPWDGRDDTGARVAAGTYFYALDTGNARSIRPMVLIP